MIGFTHLVFALALTYLLQFPVVYGMVGGMLPDIDILMSYGFPFTHRGIMHTPLAAAVFAAALYLVSGRRSPAAALGTGYVAHLFLDTFTYSGIMWLYPVETELSFGFIGYDDVVVNLGIVALSLALAVGWAHRERVRRWMR
ncbi:MAG: metal-dependent hydrolase [Candidatus Nanohaloarchaea archaeon]|nr:metal-dependent hydrolase [Candidatus Nanohaloarchaea archaeon]